MLQLGTFGKEQPVYVLCQTVGSVQQAEIERDSAEQHVALQYLVFVPFAVAKSQVFLRFMQVERGQVQVAGDAGMQPPFVPRYLVSHP